MCVGNQSLLRVRGLTTRHALGDGGHVEVLRGLDVTVDRGAALAVVGGPGSGKSTLARAVLRLLDPPARMSAGAVWWDRYSRNGPADAVPVSVDLAALPADDRGLRHIIGNDLALLAGDPLSAFSPVLPVGTQVTEGLRRHFGMKRRNAWRQGATELGQLGSEDPERSLAALPCELSRAEAQRARLAAALSCEPALLVADEPAQGGDEALRDELLTLLQRVRLTRGTALLYLCRDAEEGALIGERVRHLRHGVLIDPRHTDEAADPAAPTAPIPLVPAPRSGAAPTAGQDRP